MSGSTTPSFGASSHARLLAVVGSGIIALGLGAVVVWQRRESSAARTTAQTKQPLLGGAATRPSPQPQHQQPPHRRRGRRSGGGHRESSELPEGFRSDGTPEAHLKFLLACPSVVVLRCRPAHGARFLARAISDSERMRHRMRLKAKKQVLQKEAQEEGEEGRVLSSDEEWSEVGHEEQGFPELDDDEELYIENWMAREEWLREHIPWQVVQDAVERSLALVESDPAKKATTTSSKHAKLLSHPSTHQRLQYITAAVRGNPRDVLQELVNAIHGGILLSVGELAYVCCLAETPITFLMSAVREDTEEPQGLARRWHHVGATHSLTISPMFLHYLQEGVLRRCRKDLTPISSRGTTVDTSSGDLPYLMLMQLVWMNRGLSQVKREANITFDEKDMEHINLLQQLWAAGHHALQGEDVASPSEAPAESSSTGASNSPSSLEAGAETSAGNSASPSATLNQEAPPPSLPTTPLPPFQPKSPFWLSLGFQSSDPVTDLRGAGVLGLHLLLHFAELYPLAWAEMVKRNKRWGSPAVATAAMTGGEETTSTTNAGGTAASSSSLSGHPNALEDENRSVTVPVSRRYVPYPLALVSMQLTVLLLSSLQGPAPLMTASTTSIEKKMSSGDGGEDAATENTNDSNTAPTTTTVTAVDNPLLPVWGLEHFSLLYDGLWCATLEKLAQEEWLPRLHQRQARRTPAGGEVELEGDAASASPSLPPAYPPITPDPEASTLLCHMTLEDLEGARDQLNRWLLSRLTLPNSGAPLEGERGRRAGAIAPSTARTMSPTPPSSRKESSGSSSGAAATADYVAQGHQLQLACYDGFNRLQHEVLWHFHCCWVRELPSSVEQLPLFLERVVIPSFFRGG